MQIDASTHLEIQLSRALVHEVLRLDKQFPRVVLAPISQLAWAVFGVAQVNQVAPPAGPFLREEIRLSRALSRAIEQQSLQFPNTVPHSVQGAYAPLKRHYEMQIAEGAVD